MIDRFTRERFEAALPSHNKTGAQLWEHAGFVDGEHCYVVHVADGIEIFVRSSLRMDDVAAEAARDSIRLWLAADDRGTPLGSKEQRWIARTRGWDRRLAETLRKLWRFGRQLRRCQRCGKRMLALKTKAGVNKNRWFQKCDQCGEFAGWLREEEKTA